MEMMIEKFVAERVMTAEIDLVNLIVAMRNHVTVSHMQSDLDTKTSITEMIAIDHIRYLLNGKIWRLLSLPFNIVNGIVLVNIM